MLTMWRSTCFAPKYFCLIFIGKSVAACASHRGIIVRTPFALRSLTRYYMQRKRKSRKAGSHSTLSLLRRELREGNLQSLFGGSSRTVPSSNAAPDPLLSSFILPVGDDFMSVQSHSSSESTPAKKSSSGNVLDR